MYMVDIPDLSRPSVELYLILIVDNGRECGTAQKALDDLDKDSVCRPHPLVTYLRREFD